MFVLVVGIARFLYFTTLSIVNTIVIETQKILLCEEGFRVADDSGIAVPARMLVLQFLDDCKQAVTHQQLLDHFNLQSSAADTALGGRLQRMQQQGMVCKDRAGRYQLPRQPEVVIGRISGHANGYGFVITDDTSEDLFLPHWQMHKVLHGDRVLARCKRIDARGRKEGVVIEVLVDRQREIIGSFHLIRGRGVVTPDDARYARELTIPDHCRNGAEEDDIVVSTIIRHPVEHQHAVGQVVEIIGKPLQSGMETKIAIRKHAIPHRWPAEVTAQLQEIKDQTCAVDFVQEYEKDRHDLRDLPLVTIDGESARDFDDAVYCEPCGDGWRLIVAIADVSQYVKADTALDHEAFKRGNSVYFPNYVIPMLPSVLSNGICSLVPEQDRYCLVCDMRCTADAEIVRYQFYPAVVRSRARLTYTIVNQIVALQDFTMRQRWQQVTPHLDNLYQFYQLLSVRRRARGTIDFEFPEPYIQFDKNQKIRRISSCERNHAHRLIEECMLAANCCAARYLQENLGGLTIYRTHAEPSRESLAGLRSFLSGMGLQLTGGEQPQAADYAQLMQSVADTPDRAWIVQMVLLRSLSQAVYACEQHGHFALGYAAYTHFTSPIRRYSDLVVHRQLYQLLSGQSAAAVAPHGTSMEKIATQCSVAEQRAEAASRDAIAWLKAEFMQDKVGEEFDGVISAVKEFGVFVQLSELFIDGLIHVTALGNEYYYFDAQRFQLIGERSGQRFCLGDRLRVSVVRVNLENAKIDFALCMPAKRRLKSTSASGNSPEGYNKTFPNKKRRTQKHRGRKTRKNQS